MMVKTSRPHPETPTTTLHTHIVDQPVPLAQTPASGPVTSLPSATKKFPFVINISDSEDDSDNANAKANAKAKVKAGANANANVNVNDSDSDSDIEATYPVKIEKVYDCFEVSDDEDGSGYLRQTFDATTNTHIPAPAKKAAKSRVKPASHAASSTRYKTPASATVSASASSHEHESPTRTSKRAEHQREQPSKSKMSRQPKKNKRARFEQ